FRWYMHQDRVEFDDAIASLFGMRTPERVARVDDFAQVIHPDDRPGFFACIRACIEEGADFRMEFRVRMPDGSTRWVLDQGKSFRDAAGRPWYLTGACMDITERKVAEEELRASEARLRLAVEAGELGTWELDLRTGGSPRRTFRHDEIFGYREPLADWGYDVFLQHVLPEDRQAVDERFQAALQGGHDWHFECRIRRTDGEVRWIEARGRPATGADGRPERLLGIVADITERKTAEQERERLLAQLQLEQARLDAMVQQMPLGVFLAQAPDGRVVGYNAKAEEILGHPVVATDTPEDYARYGGEHPDGTPYRPEEYPAVRALRGEHIEQEDMVYRRGDGRLTTITVSASPVRDRAGRVMAAVCTFQDVAERRRIEQELAESERRYRFLADSIPQIVWTADASGRTDYYNGRWHEFTGLAPEESVAFGWQVSIHPEDLHPTLDAWQAAVRAKAPYRVEHRIRRFDGSYRWMLTQAAPMRDEAGRVLRWFGTSTDIDEAKRAEAEFRQESEERQAADRRLFTAMIEGSNDAIAAWDPGLRLTAFNRAFQEHVARLYGIKVTVGTKPLDTLQLLPEDRAKAEAALRRALQGETFTVASDFGPTAQERRYYETSYYPLRDGAGAVVGAFNVSRDITERVRMEQALRSSEQQLRQSQKMEAIGQLTGGVAHDFNNLLQVVTSGAVLLQRAATSEAKRAQVLEAMIQAGRRGR
ncbi:MAG TPA: PAS domain S-box protein, partial [Candidatus Thermoplasmatota archaeon]|nr:PAS domain S-box protein [Candidatus Thermoplasmatota archaeon]